MSTFSTILHKRNSTAGAIPSPSSLSAGEIAINTFDGKIFAKATDDSIKSFLNEEQLPYTLDQSLSSVNYQYGNNTVSGIFASVLNGMSNDVSGAGSSVINGSDNDVTADYALIGNGASNKIFDEGDYGAILGGQNNNLNHQESFIIGSNITSHLSGFTYVNNLSVLGKVYGDGSELNGVTGSGGGTDTEVRTLTANWESTYVTVSSLSALWEESAEILPTVIDYLSSNNVLLSSLTVTETVSVGSSLEIGDTTNTTLYVENDKVGINTETPNETLTVSGNISASGVIYGLNSSSSNFFTVQTITSATHNQVATASHNLYDDDVAGSVITVTLLPVANHVGVTKHKKIGSTASVILTPPAGVTIDGNSTFTLTTQYESISIFTDGTKYFIE